MGKNSIKFTLKKKKMSNWQIQVKVPRGETGEMWDKITDVVKHIHLRIHLYSRPC